MKLNPNSNYEAAMKETTRTRMQSNSTWKDKPFKEIIDIGDTCTRLSEGIERL